MRIEAFSEGKNLDEPGANEDAMVVLPGRGFAVIDGVTDISGRLYEGVRTGRLASRIVQRAAAEFLLDSSGNERSSEALVERASVALRDAYRRYAIHDEAYMNSGYRFGATLTMVADLGPVFRFVVIGDSGLRLNGSEVVVVDTGLDLVTAALRQEAYRWVADAGGGIDARRQVSRACSFHGAATPHPDMLPWLDAASLAVLYERSLVRCRARFPQAPVDDIRRLLDRGISGQGRFQNNTESPFSYGVLDGFDVPAVHVHTFDRPRESIRSIELFTDGYFKPGATPDLAAWEAGFRDVERVDPEKIDAYPSVKGSYGRMRTDDRTVVIVEVA